jgi:hypothetical protein
MDMVIAVRGLPVAEESSEVPVITTVPAVVSEEQAGFKEEIPIQELI